MAGSGSLAGPLDTSCSLLASATCMLGVEGLQGAQKLLSGLTLVSPPVGWPPLCGWPLTGPCDLPQTQALPTATGATCPQSTSLQTPPTSGLAVPLLSLALRLTGSQLHNSVSVPPLGHLFFAPCLANSYLCAKPQLLCPFLCKA